MMRLAALTAAGLRQIMKPTLLGSCVGLGILAGWLAPVAAGVDPGSFVGERTGLALDLVAAGTALLAVGAAAGVARRDLTIGHLEAARLCPRGGGLWFLGTAASVLVLALVAWCLMTGGALATLAVRGGSGVLESLGPRRRVVAEVPPGRSAHVQRLDRSELRLVFPASRVGQDIRLGRVPWMVRFTDPLRRGGHVRLTLLLERGAIAEHERLTWRPRGDLVFDVPESVAHAEGDVRLTLRLDARGADVRVEPGDIVLLGRRGSPGITLLWRLVRVGWTALPLILAGLLCGLWMRLPLAIVLVATWGGLGLAQPAVEEMAAAERVGTAGSSLADEGLTPAGADADAARDGLLVVALAVATRAAPDLSALVTAPAPDSARMTTSGAGHVGGPTGGWLETLLWDLVLGCLGLLLVRRAER